MQVMKFGGMSVEKPERLKNDIPLLDMVVGDFNRLGERFCLDLKL